MGGFSHEIHAPRFPLDDEKTECYTPRHSNILGLGFEGPHNIVGPEVHLEDLDSAR
jgi:hypothetical protein